MWLSFLCWKCVQPILKSICSNLVSFKIQMVFAAIASVNKRLHYAAASLLFSHFWWVFSSTYVFATIHILIISKTAPVKIFISFTLFSRDGTFIKIMKKLLKNFIFLVLLFLVLICLAALASHSRHAFLCSFLFDYAKTLFLQFSIIAAGLVICY